MFRTVTHGSRILSLCFVLWALVAVVSSALSNPAELRRCPRCSKDTLNDIVWGTARDVPRCDKPIRCKEGHVTRQACGAPMSMYVKQCSNEVGKGRKKAPCGYVGDPFHTCGAPRFHSNPQACKCPRSVIESQSDYGSSSQSGRSSSSSFWG
ncbi:uncharacterized protein PGTG_02861 [Puccinia graminis f. sp. tritici CRL 75-36-700-3]|uniref:Secreted protein n=1 Tax=Puccinia graminis f. sp. tritici (strain CRL 75-36-700-3 / race SCCL) TaxID=418459 RepID=E3JWJ5_PUCGT|nr:uncharacterized protein PGTG_02861 [Puccinia graminis f. sp. tritici CRL 75-36-700-3]EFP76420.2 hypothetical protein PGTG_02861 [Puccinia graminis f. sp. tritici CRL 75-36-700-3]